MTVKHKKSPAAAGE